jgi:hypothetical protein
MAVQPSAIGRRSNPRPPFAVIRLQRGCVDGSCGFFYETVTGVTTENLLPTMYLSPFLLSVLTHLRKSPRKEPRMLSSLHAHVAYMGLDVRRPKVREAQLP